jgi:hypothetical protein
MTKKQAVLAAEFWAKEKKHPYAVVREYYGWIATPLEDALLAPPKDVLLGEWSVEVNK